MSREWVSAGEVSVSDLASVCEVDTDIADYPNASEVIDRVLVYDSTAWDSSLLPGSDSADSRAVQEELARALQHGPGIIVMRGAFEDAGVVDAATEVFERILTRERAAGVEGGDHFGAAGVNGRIWNAQQKLALEAPDVYSAYFASNAIATGSQAWLGPGYQMTSQVNVVYPGGQAQDPHRDFHLGFLSDASAERYPRHVHVMSPLLTLQGAVAHTDMPVESGPTMLLPHSQKYSHGYVAYRRQDVREYFASQMVQLPLAKGDVLFFNPAVIHGAGTNRSSDIDRMANLLQVSSPFGRAMETLDRAAMCLAIYPTLSRDGGWSDEELANIIAATAEGYPFPTNLDRDQPVGGLAPASQADVLRAAVADRLPEAVLAERLAERRAASAP